RRPVRPPPHASRVMWSWSLEAEALCRVIQGANDLVDEVVERYAHLFGTLQHHVAAHGACEGLVLHLLPDGARIDVAHGLRRLDERDRGHEPAELIDRVEGLLHCADAWYAGVIPVALERVDYQ